MKRSIPFPLFCHVGNNGGGCVVNQFVEPIAGYEGQDKPNDTCANTVGVGGLARFNSVYGKGYDGGLLKNVYADDFLGVNFRRGLPSDDRSFVQDFCHSSPPSLKTRFRRACRAFVNGWRTQ